MDQVTRVLQELTTEGDAEDAASAQEQRVAPLQESSACRKCGEEGHQSWQCTSKKDLRKCFACGKAGHIKPNCPSRKQATSTSATPQPKNE